MEGGAIAMLIFLFCIPIVLYILFQIWVFIGYFRKPKPTYSTSPLAVSVIIPFRNEAKSFSDLIQSLHTLNYPESLVEFIFVNDHSTDESVTELKKQLKKFRFTYQIIELDEALEGKKRALTKGIYAASNSIIVCRDADTINAHCDWLISLTAEFANPKIKMIVGQIEVSFQKGFIKQYQRLEQAALCTVTRAAVFNKSPLFCSGANLAFRKSDFLDLRGYENHWHLASGDDIFLMQEMHNKHPGSIAYAHQKNALVITNPEHDYENYKAQKSRWLGKLSAGFNPLFLLGILVFLARLSTFVLPLLSFVFPQWSFIFISLALCAVLFDFLLVFLSSGFSPLLLQLPVFIIGLMWQVPMSVVLVLFSKAKNQHWKERRIL